MPSSARDAASRRGHAAQSRALARTRRSGNALGALGAGPRDVLTRFGFRGRRTRHRTNRRAVTCSTSLAPRATRPAPSAWRSSYSPTPIEGPSAQRAWAPRPRPSPPATTSASSPPLQVPAGNTASSSGQPCWPKAPPSAGARVEASAGARSSDGSRAGARKNPRAAASAAAAAAATESGARSSSRAWR